MSTGLLIAVVAGLGGMFGWGFADFFAKITIDRIGAVASLVWAHIFGTLILTLFVLGKGLFLKQEVLVPNNFTDWGLLLMFGVVQAIIYLLVYQGFGKGQLAVLNPVFASYAGMAALISIFIFGEVLSTQLIVALAVMFSGILLINLDIQALRSRRIQLLSPGFAEVGVAALLAGAWIPLWGKFVSDKDGLSYALFMYAFMTLTAYVVSKLQRIRLARVESNLWKFLVLIGLGEIVAYVSISLGFGASSHASIVALLSGSFSLPAIVLAHVFLKERLAEVQILGAITLIAGIALVSLK